MGFLSRLLGKHPSPAPQINTLPPEVQEYLNTLNRILVKFQISGFARFECVYNELCEHIAKNPLIMLRAVEHSRYIKKPLASFIHYAIFKLSAKILFRQDCYNNNGDLNEKGSGLLDICLHSAAVYSAAMKNGVLLERAKDIANKAETGVPNSYSLSYEDFLYLLHENWLLDRIDPLDPDYISYKQMQQEIKDIENLIKEERAFDLTGKCPSQDNDFISQVICFVDEECGTMDCLGIDSVKCTVKSWLENLREQINGDDNSKKDPKATALLTIMNLTYKELASGKYHVYRGALGLEGLGMQEIWEDTAKRLLMMKVVSQNDIDDARKSLSNDIACVG